MNKNNVVNDLPQVLLISAVWEDLLKHTFTPKTSSTLTMTHLNAPSSIFAAILIWTFDLAAVFLCVCSLC